MLKATFSTISHKIEKLKTVISYLPKSASLNKGENSLIMFSGWYHRYLTPNQACPK
jgi:hypothetical protein